MPRLLTIAIVLIALVSTAHAQNDDWIYSIYDIRDLDSGLADADAQRLAAARAQPLGSFHEPPRAEESTEFTRAEQLVMRVCDLRGITYGSLLPGLLSVEGEAHEHEWLSEQLTTLRALFERRYEVAILTAEVPSDQVLSVGTSLEVWPEGDVLHQVLVRRQPTRLRAVTTVSYVAALRPIVGEQSLGYDPQTATVDDGLTAIVTVGAGTESESSTMVRVTGELTQVTIDRRALTGAGGSPEFTPVGIDLPRVARRTIHAAVDVPFETLTTLAVVSGFNDGTDLVVAAWVKELD